MATVRKETLEDNNHELGGTLGATIGGVAGGIAAGAAAGAAIGGLAGPIGVVAGAAVGGALGGKAGEAVAREINPTAEEEYWETVYKTRDYYDASTPYDFYRPAYRSGVDAYIANPNRPYAEVEPELRSSWDSKRGTSTLNWDKAQYASRDAYDRLYYKK